MMPMDLIYLDQLIARMHHPERAKQLIIALRREIREENIDGFELDQTIELKLTGEKTARVKQLALVNTRALQDWFERTNLSLKPPKERLKRPTKEMVERGQVDLAAMIRKTREMYKAQAEAGKTTQARKAPKRLTSANNTNLNQAIKAQNKEEEE